MREQFDFSSDFQDLILACLIRHPGEFEAHGQILSPQYFDGTTATVVARSIFSYRDKFNRYPKWQALTQLVVDDLKRLNPTGDAQEERAADYITKLRAIDCGDREYVLTKVVDFARERAIIAACRKTLNDLEKGETPDGGFVALMEKALDVGRNLGELGLVFHQDVDVVVDTLTSGKQGVPTGWPLLDSIWRFGMQPGWLIVPLAPPKRYKSIFCTNIALNVIGPMIGKNVFYYPCEISQEMTFLRALYNITEQNEDDLWRDPVAFKQVAHRRIAKMCAGHLFMKGFGAQQAAIADIGAHARTLSKQYGVKPDLLVIDYAETIKPGDTSIPEYQQQASIYTDAAALGKALGCPVLMPDRCTKETVDLAVPSMKSFQGAFRKAGIVDAAIGLCSTDREYTDHEMRLFIFLNRHGEAYQHIRCHVDPQYARIEPYERAPYDPDDEEKQRQRRKRRNDDPEAALPNELQT